MANDSIVRVQIDQKIKDEATAVLATMGLTPSDAFRMLMMQVAREHTLPLDFLLPNEETITAIKAARTGQVQSFSSLNELMSDLHADD
ncbi:MAG: type II toxin-antitoxin system RelB/DinJ family antitoxin [Pseudanabaena sp. CAN_BIN31]|jgi:DNA-damage-inducible protein J|nr:type II toxin-antitoxin system RelB/DinJ family antitoxin [Pseudanabaena sp. CAN_BIN31]